MSGPWRSVKHQKTNMAQIKMIDEAVERRYEILDKHQLEDIEVEIESVEDFIKRGGHIEKCKYKKPRSYELTFNGVQKYANAASRKGV